MIQKIRFMQGDKTNPGKPPYRLSPYQPYYAICCNENLHFLPNEIKTIDVGLKFEVPVGYRLMLYSYNFIAHKGIQLVGAPQMYGAHQRSDLGIVLINLSVSTVMIVKHDTIAVACLEQVLPFQMEMVEADHISYKEVG